MNFVLGTELQLVAARGVAISGQVNDASASPVAGATVLARRQPEDGAPSLLSSESSTVATGATGQFMMSRLTPGIYRVMVTQGANAQKLTGSGVVDARSGDVSGAAVTAAPGAVISGTIVFEGTLPGVKGPANPRIVRLAMRSQMDAGGPGLVRGEVAQDSTFRIENMPEGPARFDISLMEGGYYVKSVTASGQDVTSQALSVGKGQRIDGVQVVIALAAAEVGGKVAPDVNPQPGMRLPVVVLFPEDPEAQQTKPRLTKVVHVNESGQFMMRGIAPGNYRLVALRGLTEDSEGDLPGNTAFLAAVQGQAKQIAVTGLRASGGILQAINAPR